MHGASWRTVPGCTAPWRGSKWRGVAWRGVACLSILCRAALRFATPCNRLPVQILKEQRDEDWCMGEIVHVLTNRRHREPAIAYVKRARHITPRVVHVLDHVSSDTRVS